MKKIILIFILIANYSWGYTYQCLYDQEDSNKSLLVHVDLQHKTLLLTHRSPDGTHHQSYSDAVYKEGHDFLHIVWDQAEIDHFEMTVRKTGEGLLRFIRSVNGSYIVDLKCEDLNAISI